MSDTRGERVEIRDSTPAPHRDQPGRDEPLLDRGTKIVLLVFVFAVVLAIAAIAVAVIAY